MTNTPIRIVIAEDHLLVREGMKALISSRKGFEVVGEADNGLDVLKICQKARPDLLLLDLSMPKMNGLSTLRQIKCEIPETRILVITMHASREYVLPTLKEGADGYLLKGDDPEELFVAMKSVIKGNAYLSGVLSRQLINNYIIESDAGSVTADDPLSPLTKREREIFQLVAEGFTNQKIGEMLFISPKTVDRHRSNMMKKMKIHSAREIIELARQSGIIQP